MQKKGIMIMLNKIGINDTVMKHLTDTTPPKQVLHKGKTPYISISSVINRLNLAFSNDWDWTNLEFWTTGEKTLNGDAVVHCKGELIVRLYDDNGNPHFIKRTGLGGHTVRMGYENAYKSASSYALRKAASTFGIGLDLSMKEEEREFNMLSNQQEIYEIKSQEAVNNTIWNDEMKQKYASYWQLIDSRTKEYGAKEEDVNALVNSWSQGKFVSIYALDETNFVAFCESFDQAYPTKAKEKTA